MNMDDGSLHANSPVRDAASHYHLFSCLQGCSEGAEECQAGMPETRTVPDAIRLGSKVRGISVMPLI